MDFLNEAEKIKKEITDIRRALHQIPEIGENLSQTMEFICSKLLEYGYKPEKIGGGIVCSLNGHMDRAVLLRADMDALGIKEEAEYEHRSKNQNMHACGHDMHTAMLLGAAKILRGCSKRLNGAVKFVFQSNEEGLCGAKKMIESGVLKSPDVFAAIALHVHSGTPSKTVLCSQNGGTAACINFRIKITGKGSHAAMPELGIDPFNVAAHIYFALSSLISHEISANEKAVLTVGKICGGTAHNIIPENVVMEGTVRSNREETVERSYKRVGEVSKNIASAFGGKCEVNIISYAPSLKNDESLIQSTEKSIKNIVGENNYAVFKNSGMGTEDFAYFSKVVPSVYFLLGAGTKEENPLYGMPMHNPKVIFNEEILPVGAAIYSACAAGLLENK